VVGVLRTFLVFGKSFSVILNLGSYKPNARYRLVRGALDFNGVVNRQTARSKYGGMLLLHSIQSFAV
jgi:hypothetical protein